MSAPILLKIVLKKSPTYVWRRFVVPSETTLDRFHGIVQTVMGWKNRRPHSFVVREQGYFPSDEMPDGGLPEPDFSLGQLIHRTGARLKYVYGPWEHDILVEKLRYANPAWPYPIYCLEGVRACPPESCVDEKAFAEHFKAMGDVSQFDVAAVNRKFRVPGPVELPKPEPRRRRSADKPDPLAWLGQLMRQAIPVE